MTKQELSNLYYLNKEIAREEERIRELEEAATSATAKLSGMPSGGKRSDKTAIATEIVYIKNKIRKQNKEAIREYNKLIDFVEDIESSQIRQIIRMRYLDMKSWEKIARSLGGDNTADGVRMIHNRFLKQSGE